MYDYKVTVFNKQEIILDDTSFINCKFTKCALVYSGKALFLEDNTFQDCDLTLKGAAARTVEVLRAIYQSSETGKRKVLEMLEGTE